MEVVRVLKACSSLRSERGTFQVNSDALVVT